ncbi:hypothetical protein BKA62DRAFT_690467 [Auriculariales sp. MPI-PUGE-AT-0066]|nr:hypothetical protein BKA62DRAFT_690467 [Auriculariales sp. MPI-PUGE-AT-0066]
MPAPNFSRLQLAAALIEYDNDPSDPNAPFRSAKESALFRPTRRPSARPQQDVGSANTQSRYTTNRPQSGSLMDEQLFKSPTEPEPEPEVDLKSWGLDGLLSDEAKAATKTRKQSVVAEGRGIVHQRSLSIPLPTQVDHDDVQSALERSAAISPKEAVTLPVRGPRAKGQRRMSFGDALDTQTGSSEPKLGTRPASMFTVLNEFGTAIPRASEDTATPFPEADNDSPFAVPLSRPTSRFDPKFMRNRAMSNATLESQMQPDQPYRIPDALPGVRDRTTSRASAVLADGAGPYATPYEAEDGQTRSQDPYAVPSDTRASAFEPGARLRRTSVTSLGSRVLLEHPEGDEPRPQLPHPNSFKYSKADLMRPKVLVMPNSLQRNQPDEPRIRGPDGFLMSTDGPPLPPGARSNAAPDDGLTFNPRQSLSLAQLTFRNTLLVGGKRDIAYTDIETTLPRAAEEGEQIDLGIPEEDEATTPLQELRPPGKYYGRSLMDDLEKRKAEMKGKKRVFTGDERPSMMQRGGRKTTFIDPSTLHVDPSGNAERPGMPRMSSAPLLNFGQNSGGTSDIAQTRSVFGVDQLWERELGKLKQIEDLERKAAVDDEARVTAKSAKKKKNKGKIVQPDAVSASASAPALVSESLPPILPDVPANGGRPETQPDTPAAASDSESDGNIPLERGRRASVGTFHTIGAKGWFASSDEEDGPRQGGPQPHPKRSAPAQRYSRASRIPQSDSDEDVPLAAQLARGPKQTNADSDSDSDKPLAALMDKRPALPALPDISFGKPLVPEARASAPKADSDEDDVPLALRHQSRFLRSASQAGHNDDDDDDKPLGLSRMPQFQHMSSMPSPAVQMLTPQQMLMQAQMQQMQMQQMQQMQMQQMQFAATASLMGGYAPAMGMPMTPFGVPMGQPAAPDPAHGRVDRWRATVADAVAHETT